MNALTLKRLKDCLFIFGAASFLFGCIASTHRGPKTLAPGQASVGASYIRAENLESPDAEPVELMALDVRAGLAKGVDLGVMHTWDISKDNENAFATLWGDFKFQVTNKDNIAGRPIFSFGVQKGYVYDEDIKTHITSLPLMLGVPINDNVTPFILYKHELFSEQFFPESFEDPRRTLAVGLDINLQKPDPARWTPRMGLCLGTFNSLAGGEGDDGLIFNVGFSMDSPAR